MANTRTTTDHRTTSAREADAQAALITTAQGMAYTLNSLAITEELDGNEHMTAALWTLQDALFQAVSNLQEAKRCAEPTSAMPA